MIWQRFISTVFFLQHRHDQTQCMNRFVKRIFIAYQLIHTATFKKSQEIQLDTLCVFLKIAVRFYLFHLHRWLRSPADE